jgi:hypothetical protein
MDWKVRLEGDDNTIKQAQSSFDSPSAKIIKDGVDWFLESTEFAMCSDHVAVRDKATVIANAILGAQSANIGLGSIYRMHYDGSKTVFKADSQ